MHLTFKPPAAEDYVRLRLRSGMGEKNLERSRIALTNSLFTASLYDGETLIGFGRVVGDGGITYIVSDIMVDRDYQRRGFAERIMQAIDGYFDENTHQDSYICLIANHPADRLYHKHGFEYLPEDKCGMLRNQKAADERDQTMRLSDEKQTGTGSHDRERGIPVCDDKNDSI